MVSLFHFEYLLAIIEDDYDSEFRFEERPIEPLQTLDTSGRVIYVGSFSKTLLPTLRLGFVVTPNSCTAAIQKAKYVPDWHTSMLIQATLASFSNGGGFARHLKKISRVYRELHELRNQILKRDFAEHLEVIPSVAGLHVAAVARSASSDGINDLVQRAADAGVAVQELSRLGVAHASPRGLILGYGAIATAHIPEGLNRLLRCFQK